MDLFDEDDAAIKDSALLPVNSKFAQEYESRKKMEELSRLQDFSESEEGSSQYSTEDSDAELDTPAMDLMILKTLEKIKGRDPTIYDTARQDWYADNAPNSSLKEKKGKVLKMKDVDRMTLLGQLSDDNTRPTPRQEEAALKAETVAAFHANDSSEDDEDLLTLRSTIQPDKDDLDYKQFILENMGGEKALKKVLKSAASTSKQDDAFLLDYILNRGWMDHSSKHVPTQAEILKDAENEEEGPSGANAMPVAHVQAKGYKPLDDQVDDDEDAEFEDRAEEFETKYNFRFEEAGGTDLTTHARPTADNSVRRTDTSRKEARQARQDRKQIEKEEKASNLARLKTLKKEAILEKLKMIQMTAGGTLNVDGLDLEGDFDEDRHAKEMEKVFGKEFYDQVADEEKPVWEDDVNIADLEFAMEDDDAYDPSTPVRKDKKKKKKGKQKLKEKVIDEAVVDDGNEDSEIEVDEEAREAVAGDLEAYYDMDYEDIIGDLPTRFKYTKVPKVDLGLTPEEILSLTDRELNAYMSIKKLAPYRTDSTDSNMNKSKRKKLKELKAALKNRPWGTALPTGSKSGEVDLQKYSKQADKKRKAGDDVSAGAAKKKRVGKKERQRMRLLEEDSAMPTKENDGQALA